MWGVRWVGEGVRVLRVHGLRPCGTAGRPGGGGCGLPLVAVGSRSLVSSLPRAPIQPFSSSLRRAGLPVLGGSRYSRDGLIESIISFREGFLS